jgi:DNA-binding response OmpR family regulator
MLNLKEYPPLKVRSQIDRASVLMVCDHVETASIWAEILQGRQVRVILASSAEAARRRLSEFNPDLVVIDLNDAHTDGIRIAHQIRDDSDVPILFFTPRGDEAHILEAYQAGVDECEPKPVGPVLFLAKVMAWLGRLSAIVPAKIPGDLEMSGLRLDAVHRKVVTGTGQAVRLSNLEFRLLHLLMQHQGWVLETERIIQNVWGYDGEGTRALLKNVVFRLRRKIEPDPEFPSFILTEAGLGYRFLGD